MNCERMEAALLALTDGRATPEERQQAAAHVADCADCGRRVKEMRATWSVLDALPGIEPSPWFDARLRGRMAEAPAKSAWLGRLSPRIRWIAVVAALVATASWISLRPPFERSAPASGAQSQADFAVVKNLPELENYDVISNFEALSALPGAQSTSDSQPLE